MSFTYFINHISSSYNNINLGDDFILKNKYIRILFTALLLYFNNLSLIEANPTTYYNEQCQISITLPDSYEFLTPFDNRIDMFASSSTDGSLLSLWVKKSSSSLLSLDDFSTNDLNEFINVILTEHQIKNNITLTLESMKPISINNHRFYEMIYAIQPTNQSTITLKSITYSTIQNGYFITVNYVTSIDSFNLNKAIFEESINSFKLLNEK